MDEQRLAERFGALGDPRRLRALRFIARENRSASEAGASVCACHVQDHLGLSQPSTSYHMKVLCEAGLVSAERRGRWVHYRISHDGLAALRGFVAELGAAAEAPPDPATGETAESAA